MAISSSGANGVSAPRRKQDRRPKPHQRGPRLAGRSAVGGSSGGRSDGVDADLLCASLTLLCPGKTHRRVSDQTPWPQPHVWRVTVQLAGHAAVGGSACGRSGG
eukprot:6725085-Prymnesium_polylepis.2